MQEILIIHYKHDLTVQLFLVAVKENLIDKKTQIKQEKDGNERGK